MQYPIFYKGNMGALPFPKTYPIKPLKS